MPPSTSPQHVVLFFLISAMGVLTPMPSDAAVSALSFYRRPDSLFPSGQAHPTDLQKKKVREFHEISYLIQKDKLSLKVPTGVLLRDMDLSLRLVHSKTGESGQVIGTRGPWAYVASGNKKSWWSLNEGLAIPDDKGLAIPLTKTFLRKDALWKTEILSELKPQTRLRLLSFKEDWIEVSLLTDPTVKGWVDVNSVVLKHDFASFILPENGKWTPVRYRQGSYMISSSGEKIAIEKVQSLMTRPDLGILTQDLEQGLYQRSFVLIKNWESLKWGVSELPGHGQVYWKDDSKSESGSGSKTGIAQAVVSFEEILKKPIFSVSFHPANPRHGIISAEGIFMTNDGLNWRRLPFFDNDNLPVAISPDHEIFVGHYRSTDQGASFHPYLKWEQIASLVEGKSKKGSRILRLVRIQPLSSKKVEIEIDTGVKTSTLIGSTKFGLVTEWKIR